MPNQMVRERKCEQVKIQPELSLGQASHCSLGKYLPHNIWGTIILSDHTVFGAQLF